MNQLARRTALMGALALALPGVSPAFARPKKGKAEEPPDDRPAVTFAGFRMFPDGRSQIWVHITGKPEVTPKHDDGSETYTLHGVKLLVRNNQNPLLTEYFHSAVVSARLRRAGKDVQLRIKTRKGTGKSTHKFHPLKDGAVSLQIVFPKAPPAAPSPEPAPRPEPKPDADADE